MKNASPAWLQLLLGWADGISQLAASTLAADALGVDKTVETPTLLRPASSGG